MGVRRGEYVYELFVTDRAAPGLTATDMVSLYLGRASFETSLSHENRRRTRIAGAMVMVPGKSCGS